MRRSPTETIRLFRAIGTHRRDRALFLVAYRHGLRASEGNVIAGRELLLGEAEGTPQRFRARHSPGFRQLFGREGPRVRIGRRRHRYLGFRHWPYGRDRNRPFGAVGQYLDDRAVIAHSGDSSRLAHVVPPAEPR